MKIAFIVSQFPALSETFILNQITGLLDLDHEVDIFANSNPHQEKVHPDVRAYRLMERTHYFNMPANKVKRMLKALGLLVANFHKAPTKLLQALNVFKYGKNALSLWLLYAFVPFLDKKEDYNIIHCHFGPNGEKGVLLRDIGLLKGKIITVFHGHDMSKYVEQHGRDVYEHLFEKGDLFLPITEKWKKKLIDMGCPEDKVMVHRMGIDTSRFQFSPRRKDVSVKLLSVGRFVAKKGLEYAIEAAAKVHEKHKNIEYQIAGDGPLRYQIERSIEEFGLENKVKLLGWQQRDEILQLMHEADILLAPSVTSEEGDKEGIPVTLMEALATGLLVIATEHSGIPELVQDGESGFLVPERDVDALAERLQYLIEHPEIWPEMGRAGRKFVEEHYNINKLNDQLVEIYQKLLDGELP